MIIMVMTKIIIMIIIIKIIIIMIIIISRFYPLVPDVHYSAELGTCSIFSFFNNEK